MKTIRASDIGTYHYCQRAWWYQQSGVESENLEHLSAGIMLHEEHGKAVITSGCLRTLAFSLFFLSLVTLSLYIIAELLGS
jgi:CRISPR/Cas system-associated exonuclease Cas4 (RecB family)